MRFSSVGLGGIGCLLCHSEFIWLSPFLCRLPIRQLRVVMQCATNSILHFEFSSLKWTKAKILPFGSTKTILPVYIFTRSSK